MSQLGRRSSPADPIHGHGVLEGETLEDRLRHGSLPIQQTLQIASAIDAAHREGIVHRDLKPANAMLTAEGMKVLDSGLPREVARAQDTLGTQAQTMKQPFTPTRLDLVVARCLQKSPGHRWQSARDVGIEIEAM